MKLTNWQNFRQNAIVRYGAKINRQHFQLIGPRWSPRVGIYQAPPACVHGPRVTGEWRMKGYSLIWGKCVSSLCGLLVVLWLLRNWHHVVFTFVLWRRCSESDQQFKNKYSSWYWPGVVLRVRVRCNILKRMSTSRVHSPCIRIF